MSLHTLPHVAAALHHGATHAHTHAGSGLGGSLAHTFIHTAVAAVAWKGVGALFRNGHGIGLVLFAAAAVAVGIYFLRRRGATRKA